MEQLTNAFLDIHWTEQIVLVTGLIYVWLAARESPWCWVWGIVSSGFWAFGSFYLYDLYIDALLQLFYVVMGVVGLIRWRSGVQTEEVLTITRMSWTEHIRWLCIGIPLALLFGYFFDEYTMAAATYPDALTTVFAIITTWLVVQKKLENWLYWIVIDGVYCWIYYRQGAMLYLVLMVVYILVAIWGYFNWRRRIGLVGGEAYNLQ